MFEDESKEPADQADAVEQDGIEAGADSAGQVSDITTESSETQAQAEPDSGLEESESAASAETASESSSSVAPHGRRGLPKFKKPEFRSCQEALADEQHQLNKSLTINEDLMVTYLQREEISESYYQLWRDDANLYFRNLCTFRLRLARMKAKAAAAEAASSATGQTDEEEQPETASESKGA